MGESTASPSLAPGEPVPWFTVRASCNPEYHFHTVAGRYAVLFFAGSMRDPVSARAHAELIARRELFDDLRASLFVVSVDPEDESEGRVRQLLPGVRIFWDDAARISTRFGVAAADASRSGALRFATTALLLDPMLRVVRWVVADGDGAALARSVVEFVAALPMPPTGPAQPQAPVLMLPRVFEPDFCRRLMAYYDSCGGSDSGYMKSIGGRVEGVVDYGFKRRSDCPIEDEALRQQIARRIGARVIPELVKAFRFRATRMERYLIARYDASVGGFFRPHRDNDGGGHREFAVTLNLNAEDYEGGDLRFPEYGLQTYRAPTGGACIFSCALLHEATPVTRGVRYAFLPFLYDEAAARRREKNNPLLTDPSKHYRYEPK